MTPAHATETIATVAAAEFSDAMSTLASGVVLVTCRLIDRPWGMTVTAFASVSAHPPTVLVSLGSRTASARAIAATGAFGVSILSRDQVDLAEYGAARGAAKFLDSLTEPRDRESASPALARALAHLHCDVVEAVDAADHTVFFGHVHTVRRRRGGDPLLYHGRGYRSFFAPDPTTERNLRCVSS
jgi:flavin reductase (DIM6/NTAB) family NADH-FMN oxidoreductase RutF